MIQLEKNLKLVMKSSMRKLDQGGLGKRLIALIMDAIVFAFVWGCLVSWVFTPIANNAMSYNANRAAASHYQVFSKLYTLKELTVKEEVRWIEPSTFTKIESDSDIAINPLYNSTETDVEFYRARLKYYYCNYKTNKNIEYDPALTDESIKARYYSPLYNVPIDDGKGNKVLPGDYYTESWFNENFGPEKIKTVDEAKNAAYDAVAELYNSSYFQSLNNKIKGAQAVIIFPPYVISFMIFYMLVPCLYKNGETFGKKVMGLGFVSKDGYDLKKRQIVFRQLLLFFWVSLSAFIIGVGTTSLATLGIGVVIYLIATLISKTKRSPIDYASYLYLIDAKSSIWFHDPKEEEEKEVKYEEKMAKYKSHKVENKNLIQIGDEIIDEDLKKEIEEEKLKEEK